MFLESPNKRPVRPGTVAKVVLYPTWMRIDASQRETFLPLTLGIGSIY